MISRKILAEYVVESYWNNNTFIVNFDAWDKTFYYDRTTLQLNLCFSEFDWKKTNKIAIDNMYVRKTSKNNKHVIKERKIITQICNLSLFDKFARDTVESPWPQAPFLWTQKPFQTPNDDFFHWHSGLLDLGRQIGLINSGAFGVFLAKKSATILVQWVPCPYVFQYSINHYFYRKLSLYIHIQILD